MSARSYLYVPADKPEMLASCMTRGADAIVVDLEDGVGAANKPMARDNLSDWLHRMSRPDGLELWVRINSTAQDIDEDLEAIGSSRDVSGLVVPKAEQSSLARLQHLPEHFGLVPLIETARGLLQLPGLAATPQVRRLGVGLADLVATLGVEPGRGVETLQPVLVQIVVVAAATELLAPIAPVSTDVGDSVQLEETTEMFRAMGFGARTAVHPNQVEIINRAFTPTAEEVAKAERLLGGSEGGPAVRVDENGQLIDEAILRSARRVLEQARVYGTR